MSNLFRQLVAKIPGHVKRQNLKQAQIATQLGSILKEQGWSKTRLAEESGLKNAYISRVLAGASNLTLGTIARLEQAIGRDLIEVPMFRHEEVDVLSVPATRLEGAGSVFGESGKGGASETIIRGTLNRDAHGAGLTFIPCRKAA